jgi:hypothetical protein
MVENYTTIKERLRQIAKNKGISYEKLYKIIEMTDGSFKGSAIKRSLNSDAIVKFYTEFPDVNLEWLITGKERKKEEKEKIALNEPSESYGKNYKDLYIEVLEENRQLNKELISQLKKTSV